MHYACPQPLTETDFELYCLDTYTHSCNYPCLNGLRVIYLIHNGRKLSKVVITCAQSYCLFMQ